jgi:membrane protein DedA with SNARE-associated domain
LAGFTAYTKNLGIMEGAVGMSLTGAAGSTVGAIIIYCMSRRLGRMAVLKLGKYVGIGEKELEKTEKWFERHGRSAVFFGRMAPGIRELVSIPAGIDRMKFSVFVAFTFLGSLMWCSFLTFIGFYLGEAWNRFYVSYSFIFDILSIVIVGCIILGIIMRHYQAKRKDTSSNIQ